MNIRNPYKGCYVIIFYDGKCYVGMSTLNVITRCHQHFKGGDSQAVDRYIKDNSLNEIEVRYFFMPHAANRDIMLREAELMIEYDSMYPNGLNIRKGCGNPKSNLSYTITDEDTSFKRKPKLIPRCPDAIKKYVNRPSNNRVIVDKDYVLSLIGQGYTHTAIAKHLGVGRPTMKFIVESLVN